MRKRLIASCLNLLLLLIVGSTVVYAWYTNGHNTAKVTITTANLATEVDLYIGNDFNYDGNLDLVLDTQTNTNVESFTEVTTKSKTDDKTFNLVFSDLIPTEIHTWKFVVRNLGEASGYFSINLSKEIKSEHLILIKFMSVSYYKVLADGEEVFSSKVYLFDKTANSIIAGNTTDDFVKLGTTETFVVRFKIEEYSNLVSQGIISDTPENYNLYQSLQTYKSQTDIYNFIEVVLCSEIK